MSTKRVLVVTGGTEVDIDDVRVLTNRSVGRFGVTIADSFASLSGFAVTLLAAKRTLRLIRNSSWSVKPSITCEGFRTFDELHAQTTRAPYQHSLTHTTHKRQGHPPPPLSLSLSLSHTHTHTHYAQMTRTPYQHSHPHTYAQTTRAAYQHSHTHK